MFTQIVYEKSGGQRIMRKQSMKNVAKFLHAVSGEAYVLKYSSQILTNYRYL